jgi:uridine kinase
MLPGRYDEIGRCATLLWMATISTFAELADRIMRVDQPVRFVGVDGCGGAGKTTFATRLAKAANNAPIVHTDDFASHDVPIDWWPRLRDEVINPLMKNKPATYRPYNWVTRKLDAAITVEPTAVVIIEGVSATRKEWRDQLALKIWIETARDLRLQRGIERDGEELRDFWIEWMKAEDSYVDAQQPMDYADLIVDGNPQFAHDPETEFVVIRAANPTHGSARGPQQ